MTPRRGDRGQVTVYVLVTTAVIAACLGLVFDAGRMLLDKARASSAAHEAARAGAQQVDLDALAAGQGVHLDRGAALRAAYQHLADTGTGGEASVDGDTVTVTARRPYTSFILPIGQRVAEARASATAVTDPGR